MSKHKDLSFDRRAAAYDDGWEGKRSWRFYRLLLAQVRLEPGMAVLDVGCGTGTVLRKLADRVEIDGCGVDVSVNMIEQARQKCPGMDIRTAPAENMPFADRRFDVITACMAYHHLSDKQGFAREASRLLKHGGMLYICDPRFPGQSAGASMVCCVCFSLQGSSELRSRFMRVSARLGFCSTVSRATDMHRWSCCGLIRTFPAAH